MSNSIHGGFLNIEDLPTPCLIVDKPRMLANIKRLKDRVRGTGVTLRPHLKTVKSIEIARLVMPAADGPAAVSTLKEAEEFGKVGITDLLYAVCISPQKLDRVAALRKLGIDLKIIVDSVEMAERVASHCRASNDAIPTLIEVDVDGHRSGVPLGDYARLIAIGNALHNGAELRGVMAHGGEIYNLSEGEALIAAAEAERRGTFEMAQILRESGLACPVVSVGSTPMGFSACSFEGVTELRAGVYVFFDLYQAGVGVCNIDDIALSVLTTVIGHQHQKEWIISDAGWMALSNDRGTESQDVDQHLGVVCDLAGRPYNDLVVLRANQEHGIITPRPGSSATLPDLPIGSRLRVLPNHACATSAQHDRYHVINGENIETWNRFTGW